MRLNKATASFGKLENETLSFHPGLNVIYAPNESGKSTWCAFIRAMLYGVDSSERSRAGYMPDKLRYVPWSGAPMEGTLEVTADRCDITLTRTTKSKSAPMRDFSATYTGTNTPVDGMTAANAGELLTGVSKDVFNRSAFIPQGAVPVSGSPELERRINSIVSTGEEDTSYTEADERLRAWQRKRRFNRRGTLPELEARMDDTQRTLSSMDETLSRINELEESIAQSAARCTELEAAVTVSRKHQRKEALDKLNRGRAELKSAGDEHDRALAALSEAKDELRRGPFGALSAAEAESAVASDLEELDRLKAASKNSGSPILALIFFVLAVVSAAVYAKVQSVLLIISAAVFCIAAVALLLRYSKMRRAAEEAKAQRRSILERYNVRAASDIRSALDIQRGLCDALSAAEHEEQRTRAAYEAAHEQQERLEEAALGELDFSSGSSMAAQLSRQLLTERQRTEQLSAQLAALNGRLAAIGDPLVLASELETMQEEYDEVCSEYDAISLAVDTLHAADAELQSRFSPQLGRLAAEYMSIMTGGRYSDVLINSDLSAKARANGETVAHEAGYLSTGTLDLLYFAVRLAVCELALPKGEPCPLIIDDALVNLDPERTKQAMSLLRELARERQIILFTCRELPAGAGK